MAEPRDDTAASSDARAGDPAGEHDESSLASHAEMSSTDPRSAVSERLSVRIDPRSAVWIALGVIVLFVGGAFFRTTVRSLTVIGVGVLLAFAVEPLVLAVERRVRCRRGFAVGVVGALLAIALGLLVVLVGPPAARQAQRFGDELPQTLLEIEELPVVGPRLEQADFAPRVERWVDGLPGRLDSAGVGDAARSALNGMLNALGALLVTVVVLIDGPRLIDRLRTAVPPEHRDRADAVGRVFYRVVGTYFAGSLLVAGIGGTWVLIVALSAGVPLAPVAAVWYATVSLIPQVGGFLGTSFVTILALTQGVVPALIVLVLVVAYMNLENYIITPAIVGEAVDLSPPVTMLAALIGGAAAGVPGALAATPLCGTVKALYREARGEETEAVPTRLRDRLEVPAPIRAVMRRFRPAGGDVDG